MKVLFFIESLFSGGKERRLVELLQGLQEYQNIRCELVITRSYIHYKKIHELGIPIHIIERKNLKKDPRLFLKFYKLSKRIKPDIIHVWGSMVAIYAIPSKVLLRIPMINQISDAPQKPAKGLLSYKSSFPFSNFVLANSKAGLNAYKPVVKERGVIYNGFNLKRLNNLQDLDLIRHKFKINSEIVIGMVASFSDKKDYTTYINAALTVLKENKNITFLCVGSGDYSKYKKMIPENFKTKIVFIEAQKDIMSLMRICHIGVLATYTEGISNAIMEFMALGKPVIATDGGGTKELISDCVTGFLVKRESANELSDKIMQLLRDKSNRERMGVNGKNRIIEEFNIEPMIAAYKDVYNKINQK